jgi:flagellar protein FlaI
MPTAVKIVDEKPVKKYIMDKPSIEVLMDDAALEEVMINAPDVPVIVYHREHGMCETNLVLKESQIIDIINQNAMRAGERLDITRPFLDARMPDGSRLNATIPPATPEGPTVTIRKFMENPLSIVDIINLGTMSTDLAAFLWMSVEGQRNFPLNILVIGGAGSGKTTTLNVLAAFVPMEERIIAIEDTLELIFPGRSNVVRMEAKAGFIGGEGITMNMLLANALRMRPDRLIMGEVRGPEAESLFNAMNVGHSAMGTLHANSPGECSARLTNAPMNVPTNMLPLMDLIVIQQKIRSPSGLRRRVTQVVEVARSEVGISFSEIFTYDPKTDRIKRTDVPSQKEEKLAALAGVTLTELKRRRDVKKGILQDILDSGTKEFFAVQKMVQDAYNTY